jgi:natural product precursor
MNKQKLSKLKLNKLSESQLEKRAMKVLKGGCQCASSCQGGGNLSELYEGTAPY